MSAERKLCKNCRWFKVAVTSDDCQHEQSLIPDYVNGEDTYHTCQFMRREGDCGLFGRLWEPKP